MRFLFCKNRCPSICFCHPSSHIYAPPQPSPSPSSSPSPFQLEGVKPSPSPVLCQQPADRVSANEPDAPSLPASKAAGQTARRLEPPQTLELDQKNIALGQNGSTVNSTAEDYNNNNHQHHESSNDNVGSNGNGNPLKGSLRRSRSDSVLAQKKKVQWVDHFGKELTEIREFEYSEDIDYASMNRRGCECTIL